MRYKILDCKTVFKGSFLEIDEAKVEIDKFKGGTLEIERSALKRPEVSAVLLEIVDRKEIVFVEQFRYSSLKLTKGWMKEIIAGVIEDNETPKHAAIRETKEETGYLLSEVKKITTYFSSAGISDQIMHLFFGQVRAQDKLESYQNLLDDGEDIRTETVACNKIPSMLEQQQIFDAKTIIALQWYAINFL